MKKAEKLNRKGFTSFNPLQFFTESPVTCNITASSVPIISRFSRLFLLLARSFFYTLLNSFLDTSTFRRIRGRVALRSSWSDKEGQLPAPSLTNGA